MILFIDCFGQFSEARRLILYTELMRREFIEVENPCCRELLSPEILKEKVQDF